MSAVEPGLPEVVRVHPAELEGRVRVPGDKSVSHRALLLGALVGTPTAVSGVAPSGDVAATAEALRALGATVELEPGVDGQLRGTVVGPLRPTDQVLDCGNSGTAMRLLAGVVAGLPGSTVLTGDDSLRQRPMDRVAEPLRSMGARVEARDGRFPPLTVHGGALRGTEHTSTVASAQVKSCVLLAGLAAEGDTLVRSPRPSRDHTERMLRAMGADVTTTEEGGHGEVVRLRPGPIHGLGAVEVPGDPSSAAFWLVAAAVGTGAIELPGVLVNERRDGVVRALARLGGAPELIDQREVGGERVGTYVAAPVDLGGGAELGAEVVVDGIDELPILALAGALSRDGLVVRDAAELRVKESDRIATTGAAFRAVGLAFEERPDGYRVPGGQRPGPGRVEAHGDHRIAMTAAIAGTVATGPVEITGFGAVATSYPSFLDDLRRLGGRAEVLATT